MQWVRQCKDTFIRRYNDLGYITSQLSKRDRVYDEIGALFLSKINRTARTVDEIVDELHAQFSDVSREVLRADFGEFIQELAEEGFLVTGRSEADLDRKDHGFSYLTDAPKTAALNFLAQDKNPALRDTADFFYSYFRDHPVIFGMHLEITGHCNERCLHCYLPRPEKAAVMPLSMARDLLDQLQAMGTVSVTFSGGEPFTHKQFAEMLIYARNNDFSINILTNGTLIRNEIIPVLKQVNLNMVQVSIYSMDPEIHDRITQHRGSLRKTLAATEKLIASGIPVQISCPVMRINKDSYTGVAQWARQHQVRVLSDFIMMARTDFDTGNLAYRLSIDETGQLIRNIINEDETYQAILAAEPPAGDAARKAEQPVCGVGVDNACVNAEGNVYPCAGFQGITLGNVSQQSLADIWANSEALKALRAVTNASFPQCLNCAANDYCAMCLVRNFNESGGDIFAINEHYCKVAFLTKDLVAGTAGN